MDEDAFGSHLALLEQVFIVLEEARLETRQDLVQVLSGNGYPGLAEH